MSRKFHLIQIRLIQFALLFLYPGTKLRESHFFQQQMSGLEYSGLEKVYFQVDELCKFEFSWIIQVLNYVSFRDFIIINLIREFIN